LTCKNKRPALVADESACAALAQAALCPRSSFLGFDAERREGKESPAKMEMRRRESPLNHRWPETSNPAPFPPTGCATQPDIFFHGHLCLLARHV
jgi:hypothetical protein